MSVNTLLGQGDYANGLSLITSYRLLFLLGIFLFLIYKYALKIAKYQVGSRANQRRLPFQQRT